MDQLTFLSEEPPVSHSASQDCDEEWMTTVASWRSSISNLLIASGLSGTSFGRMSLACSPAPTDETSRAFFLALADGASASLETDGRTAGSSKVLPDATDSCGECWTLNTSEWNHTLVPFPNDDVVCSLSDVLETGDVPRRYYLSPKACAGILRRAEKRERELPEALRLALESGAS